MTKQRSDERQQLTKDGQMAFLRYVDALCLANNISVYRLLLDCSLPRTFISNLRKGYRTYPISLDIVILLSRRYQFPFLLSDYLVI